MALRSDSVACSIPERNTNTLLPPSRCCFTFPCFGSRRSRPFSSSSPSPTSPSSSSSPLWWDNSWLSGGIQAIKKINRKGGAIVGNSNNNHHGRFQYDPLSYALNFDEGQHLDFDDYDDDNGGGGFRDFSSRYASVSGSGKPLNMDSRGVSESSAVIV